MEEKNDEGFGQIAVHTEVHPSLTWLGSDSYGKATENKDYCYYHNYPCQYSCMNILCQAQCCIPYKY